MYRITERKPPVSPLRAFLALLNYFGGYLYLYPRLARRINQALIGAATLTLESMAAVFALTLAVNLALLYPYLLESWPNFRAKLVRNCVRPLLYLLVLLAGGGLISYLIAYFAGSPESLNQQEVEVLLRIAPGLMYFSAVVFAPVTEELIFRGIFFRSLRPRLGLPLSLAVSGLSFGLAHVASSLFAGNFGDLPYLLVYGLLGAVFAWVYEDRQNIFSCIFLHAVYNLIALLAL